MLVNSTSSPFAGEAVRLVVIFSAALFSSSSKVTPPFAMVYSVLNSSAVSSVSVNDKLSAAEPITTLGELNDAT